MVKAFNTVAAESLRSRGEPAGTAGRVAVPVAGDDAAEKGVVMRLADELGFDAVDAGSLDDSWRMRPGTPVYTADLDTDAALEALDEADPEQTATWRG
ncbi:hypothetical protein [Amycolatopsis sp. MEPSY49]|uniref:hypothetical protein n=1 Tax=Amycolatopsis sp. MEPSY49 TaxID=3151600 RepID=UPI003EF32065